MVNKTNKTPSIFTKIISNEIPSYKIYEDDEVLAFLDIYPIQPGHMLVVPKQQVDPFTNLSTATYGHLMAVCRHLAIHLQSKTKCKRVVLRIDGYDVPHTHVHLVPSNTPKDTYKPGRMDIAPNYKELEKMAKKLTYGENIYG